MACREKEEKKKKRRNTNQRKMVRWSKVNNKTNPNPNNTYRHKQSTEKQHEDEIGSSSTKRILFQ
jgi:hypothetical protein